MSRPQTNLKTSLPNLVTQTQVEEGRQHFVLNSTSEITRADPLGRDSALW